MFMQSRGTNYHGIISKQKVVLNDIEWLHSELQNTSADHMEFTKMCNATNLTDFKDQT